MRTRTNMTMQRVLAWGSRSRKNGVQGGGLMGSMFARTSAVMAGLMGLAVMAACSGGVTDIDRTQANRVDKATFDGEWYFRPVVIDAQYNQGIMFEGLNGEMERIKWDIRENELVAYRSWEQLINAEDGNGSTTFTGPPVAAFKIVSHFDVLRDYNAATGEQSNVLLENTTDRPWYKRQYMRVDWSQNLLKSPYQLEGLLSALAGAPYYVQEHEIDNPHRAEITPTNINIVQNYLLSVDDQTCEYHFRDYPTMCNGSQAKMKLSFRKVTPSDYESLYYPDSAFVRDSVTGEALTDCPPRDATHCVKGVAQDGFANACEPANPANCSRLKVPMFERFGFFRTQRLAYDHEYQWTRDGRVQLANRWNIWAKSHDKAGNVLPMQYRAPGFFSYAVNEDFPTDADVWSATEQLVQDWDWSFRETAAILKDVVPRALPTDQQGYADRRAAIAAKIDPIYRLEKNHCNIPEITAYAAAHGYNDVLKQYGLSTVNQGNFKRACAVLEYASHGDFTWQKIGDLRHSFIHWVHTPQNAGPLGYGPSHADPISGEIISASANIYGASVNTLAAYAADLVALANGDLQLDTVVKGENIREHMQRAREQRFGNYSIDKIGQLQQRVGRNLARDMAGRAPAASSGSVDVSMLTNNAMTKHWADLEANIRKQGKIAASRGRLEKIAGSYIDRELLTNDDLQRALAGPEVYQPTQNATAVTAVSGAAGTTGPAGLSGTSGGAAQNGQGFSALAEMLRNRDLGKREHEWMLRLASRNITMMEWADEGMVSLVKDLQGKTWDEVYAFMRREIYRSVTAHEVGHTLGLRHNFEGSYDPLNYHREFWEYYDPTTQTVQRRDAQGNPTRAERLMYSSIMDYDARFYADSYEGIGPYDHAAIKFGYGGLVEVFEPDVPALYYENMLFLHDYTKIPKILSGTQACQFSTALFASNNTSKCPAVSTLNTMGSMGFMQHGIDNAPANPKNVWRRNHVTFDELYSSLTAYHNADKRDYDPATTKSFVLAAEVPYKFCPDDWAGSSNVSCQPYDKGANFREMTADRMERYDAYYFFTNFKRDRYAFNDNEYMSTYLDKLIGRYFGPMSNVYRYYLYGFQVVGYDNGGKPLTLNDFEVGQNWSKAAMDGLNYINSVIQQPSPGKYCLDQGSNVYQPWSGDDASFTAGCANKLDVPVGVGKYYNTKWTDEYYYKATTIGTFYDKWAALWSLTDNEGVFYQNFNDMLDSGSFALSYWRGLQPEMLNVFDSMFTGRTSSYAWRVQGPPTDGKFIAAPAVDVYDAGIDYNALPRVAASTSWSLRYYGVVLPMARFNSMYDYTEDFSNYSRICLDGSRDCLAYGHLQQTPQGEVVVMNGTEGVDYSAFVDPTTGFRYIAPKTTAQTGALGAHLLDEANQFVNNTYQPAFNTWQTAKHNYDQLVAQPGAPAAQVTQARTELGDADRDLSTVERQLHERTSFLDIIRDVSFMMEYGG